MYLCKLNYIALKVSTLNNIVDNLDRFIRKYYKNRLLKGLLYSVGILGILFLLEVVLEHFGYFGTGVRTLLFWLFIVVFLVVIGYYVVVPLLKMNRLGKVLSYEEASQIVGNHFPEIKDKLLNLLQLQNQEVEEGSLLAAAIEQKTAQLSPIPFANAVDLKKNRKYIKYAVLPLSIVLLLLIIAPSFITEPSKRIVHHSTAFQRPAPFAFVVNNSKLEASQQEDFLLEVSVEGDAIPNEAFINIEGKIYKLTREDKTHYSYLFKNLQHTVSFNLQAVGVESIPYELTVFPKPTVVNFQALLSYPAYIGKPNEVVSNVGDLTVPQGTTITWQFQTKACDTLYFIREDHFSTLVPDQNGRLKHSVRMLAPMNYGFFVSNQNVPTSDTLRFAVQVVSDCAPAIMAMEMRDSLTPNRIYFKGQIKDDYGFSRLEFRLEKTNADDTSIHQQTTAPIAITKENNQEFYYTTNLNELVINPGDRIKYYFVVWDNDGINGPKSATSQVFEINIPTEKELDNLIDNNYDQIEDKAEASIHELKKLQKEIDELMRRLVDKKELNWQDKKQLEELLSKQKEVKDNLQKMQKQIQENNRLEEHYRQQSEEIMEKQRELDKLFDQVMTDEMKEMMQEIEKLMQDIDKKQVQEQLENLKLKNEDIERQLDQNLELMKRLEMEKKVEEAVRKAETLSQKQDELSKKTADSKPKDKEALQNQQEKLNQQFEDLKKDIESIQREYKEIAPTIEFKIDNNLENKIQQEQKKASEQLNKGKQKDASQQQKEAAEDLDKLSEQLAEAQQDIEQEELAEDAEQIRQLLKNLVTLSFNQEGLIKDINTYLIQDPKYQQIIRNQNIIKEDFRNVADSLQAMAKRQVQVASAINKDLSSANLNIAKSLSGLLQFNQTFYGSMKNTQSARNMQYAMTSMNNLALVLAESLDQMQNQMRQNQQQKKNGSCKNPGKMKNQGSCSNPGKGKPSPKSMKQMQEELNKQMEALKKQLDKQGNKPGRAKIGDKGSTSEEFARMAAQQEQIRRMMQQYGQEIKNETGGNSKLAKEINELIRQMEQTETDLVNKTITQQTIKRQQQIMTRLLEHEKAEMQREKEDRRKSNEAKDIYQTSPADIERFNKMQEKNMELFRTVPPNMSNYYKSKINDYFYNF